MDPLNPFERIRMLACFHFHRDPAPSRERGNGRSTSLIMFGSVDSLQRWNMMRFGHRIEASKVRSNFTGRFILRGGETPDVRTSYNYTLADRRHRRSVGIEPSQHIPGKTRIRVLAVEVSLDDTVGFLRAMLYNEWHRRTERITDVLEGSLSCYEGVQVTCSCTVSAGPLPGKTRKTRFWAIGIYLQDLLSR